MAPLPSQSCSGTASLSAVSSMSAVDHHYRPPRGEGLSDKRFDPIPSGDAGAADKDRAVAAAVPNGNRCATTTTTTDFAFCHPSIAAVLAGPADGRRRLTDTRQKQKQKEQQQRPTTTTAPVPRTERKGRGPGAAAATADGSTTAADDGHEDDDDDDNGCLLPWWEALSRFGETADGGMFPGPSVPATVHDLADLAAICDEIVFPLSPPPRHSHRQAESDGGCDMPGHERNTADSRTTGTTTQDFLSALVEEILPHRDDPASRRAVSTSTSTGIVTVATLLALNALEATIRRLAGAGKRNNARARCAPSSGGGGGTGGSPLLKDMIATLGSFAVMLPPPLVHVCRLLLLPTDGGLNFRNLVWHGFLPNVPRPWFALVVVVTRELDKLLLPSDRGGGDSCNALFDLRDYPEYSSLLLKQQERQQQERQQQQQQQEEAENLRLHGEEGTTTPPFATAADDLVTSWLQSSTASPGHVALWTLAKEWMTSAGAPSPSGPARPGRPATVCAILCVVLEHGLRVAWCSANGRPDDRIARPGALYLTLDGHGQRHVHDLILHPYLLDGPGRDGIPGTGTLRRNR